MPIKVWLSNILLILTFTSTNANYNMDSEAMSSLGFTKFSAKFCNELAKNKSVVSSPLSAEFVLALLILGSNDPSHAELSKALDVTDDDMIRSKFRAVSSKLQTIKGVTLNVANKIFIKNGNFELESQFKKDATEVFESDVEKLDFGSSSAASHINQWVEKKTNNRIKDLLSQDDLNELTRLVLVNAIYFKGSWKKKFDQKLTKDKTFHINNSSTSMIPMMYKEDNYRYGECEALQAQLLELPYEGEEASMIVVLPNEIEGLDKVMQKLADGYDLMGDVEKMYTTKVQVTIPKFKIETSIDLNELLPKLGITSIFDQHNSGLDRMLHDRQVLYVSKAIQKAFIEVNEEGAEAAAATGAVMMLRCARLPLPSQQFVADRPFFYMLLAARTPYIVGVFVAA